MSWDTIMAWDPGESTGFCLIQRSDNVDGFVVLSSAVIPWNDRLRFSESIIRSYPDAIIVCEKFTLYKGKERDQVGKSFPSCQMWGSIDAFAHLYGDRTLIMQPAHIMLRVEVLPGHLGIIAGRTAKEREHALDAYKHARYYAEYLNQLARRKEAQRAPRAV